MDHSRAERIFEDIRQEPYRVSTHPNISAPNCYFKGIKLIQELAQMGYPVTACVAEMDWNDTPVPKDIVALRSPEIVETHFYIKVYIDDQWRVIDPSIDDKSEKLGFRAVRFGGDERTCFDLKKVYAHAEQIAVMAKCADPAFIERYFSINKAFLEAVNIWLDENR